MAERNRWRLVDGHVIRQYIPSTSELVNLDTIHHTCASFSCSVRIICSNSVSFCQWCDMLFPSLGSSPLPVPSDTVLLNCVSIRCSIY
jgi:hypothetical protein